MPQCVENKYFYNDLIYSTRAIGSVGHSRGTYLFLLQADNTAQPT